MRPPRLATKVSRPQQPVGRPEAQRLAVTSTADSDITPTFSSKDSPPRMPKSDRRDKKQIFFCAKCGGSFRSLWYCCIGCFSVLADTVTRNGKKYPRSNLVGCGLWGWASEVRYGVKQRACGGFWDEKLGYLPILTRQGLAVTGGERSSNLTENGTDRASSVDDRKLDQLEREQTIDMEARCAECWRTPTYPAASKVQAARGPGQRGEPYDDDYATCVMQCFDLQRIPSPTSTSVARPRMKRDSGECRPVVCEGARMIWVKRWR